VIIFLLAACSGPVGPDIEPAGKDTGGTEQAPDTAVPETPVSTISDAALLRRISLDFRGVPPSEAELDQLTANPSLAPNIRDAMLRDSRFGERLVHLFAERWHTRVDVFDIVAYDYGLDRTDEYTFERSVGEEPLRILSHVVTEDLPWTEVVLGDWTMANELLAEIWPIDYPEEGSGWQVSRYTDSRPAAGVMATNGLWWRYTTTDSNMNRGRAAAISRLLLCEDYLQRPVAFSEANTTLSSTADAAQEDPYCLACHASLDPVAASLFGFWWLSLYSEIEETTYHPEREALWEQHLGTAPAWFGTPISGLPDLGVSVARDSRFYTCAVESMAETLWRRPVTLDDADELEALRVGFLEDETRMRPLLAAITETDAYRSEDQRMITHDQLHNTLEALTGFRWTFDGFDELDSDESGYRMLLGGVDGIAIRSPQQRPGMTWALVVKRAAEAAAAYSVDRELSEGLDGVLFQSVSLSDAPGDPAFDQELRSLHRRMYSTEASDSWLSDVGALWTAVAAEQDAQVAWSATISAMLRDPALLTY